METFTDQFGIIRPVVSSRGPRLAPTRPIVPPRSVATPRRAAPTRRVGYQSGEPHLLCGICFQPAHFCPGTLLCSGCAAAVAWRVALARSGLRVVA